MTVPQISYGSWRSVQILTSKLQRKLQREQFTVKTQRPLLGGVNKNFFPHNELNWDAKNCGSDYKQNVMDGADYLFSLEFFFMVER